MKYLTCPLLLILVAPLADAAPFSWVVTDTDSRVVAALALAAKPAKATECGIADCPCGCADGKACTCSEYAEFLAWKRSRAELSKPYAGAWQAEGWTYDGAKGYWTKPAPQPFALPMQFAPPAPMQFAPSAQSFGGGMRGGRGCSGGG